MRVGRGGGATGNKLGRQCVREAYDITTSLSGHAGIYVCMYVCMCVCVCVRVSVCQPGCVFCMSVYMSVCVCM